MQTTSANPSLGIHLDSDLLKTLKPKPNKIRYYATTRFLDLQVHQEKTFEELQEHAELRIKDSALDDASKILLTTGVKAHLKHLANASQNNGEFRATCGLSNLQMTHSTPGKPSIATQFTLMNLKLIDCLLDSCRDLEDTSNLSTSTLPASAEPQYGLGERTLSPIKQYSRKPIQQYLKSLHLASEIQVIPSIQPSNLVQPVALALLAPAAPTTDPVVEQLKKRILAYEIQRYKYSLFSEYGTLAMLLRIWCLVSSVLFCLL